MVLDGRKWETTKMIVEVCVCVCVWERENLMVCGRVDVKVGRKFGGGGPSGRGRGLCEGRRCQGAWSFLPSESSVLGAGRAKGNQEAGALERER